MTTTVVGTLTHGDDRLQRFERRAFAIVIFVVVVVEEVFVITLLTTTTTTITGTMELEIHIVL